MLDVGLDIGRCETEDEPAGLALVVTEAVDRASCMVPVVGFAAENVPDGHVRRAADDERRFARLPSSWQEKCCARCCICDDTSIRLADLAQSASLKPLIHGLTPDSGEGDRRARPGGSSLAKSRGATPQGQVKWHSLSAWSRGREGSRADAQALLG